MTKQAKSDFLTDLKVGDKVKVIGYSSQRGKFATVELILSWMVEVTIHDFDDEPEYASGWCFWPDELEKVDES